jgi:solute carrier family 25, member 34/35
MQVQGELERRQKSSAPRVATLGGRRATATTQAAQRTGKSAPIYRNAWQGMGVIWRAEGWRGVQKGLVPAVAYQFSMNGIRLGSYSVLKSALDIEGRSERLQAQHKQHMRERDNGERHSQEHAGESMQYYTQQAVLGAQRVAVGAGVGVLGAVTASPFYLVKTRMQVSSPVNTTVGAQRNYAGLGAALREVYAEGGLRELWRGSHAASFRVAGGSSAQLASYDWCKSTLHHSSGVTGTPLHLLASLYSGVFVVLVMNPFDVVSTRIYNQPIVDGRGTLYQGVRDCFRKTLRAEGVHGLYKGTVCECVSV